MFHKTTMTQQKERHMSHHRFRPRQSAHRIAALGLCLVLLGLAPVHAEDAAQAGRDALTVFFEDHGVRSDAGWTAGAVEQEGRRYLLVQYDETGEVYQLGDLDDAAVENLAWPKGDVLQVAGAHPDGSPFEANIRLSRKGDSARFEFIHYAPGVPGRSEDFPTTGPSVAPASGWRQMQPVSEYGRWRSGR
jgi:hypothetical protein